jgi:glycosyltransferase involved in cell wall biosynthesis
MLIIGKGPEEERLNRLIEEMGLGDSVRIQDWLPRNEVLKAMRSSDVFLFPSFRDGGGAVVVEAMASGLPVICLGSGGPGSHVRAEWGIKVSPSDPDRVALEMGRALKTLHDDEGFRAALGEAARKRAAEYYLWDALGERLHEIYRSIVPGPRGSEDPSGVNLRA